MHIGPFLEGLVFLGSVGFLLVIYYAFRLSRETKHEKYWVVLALSALFLGIHQWVLIPWELHLITDRVRLLLEQVSAIFGAVLFAYAVYGLHSSMKSIRKRME